MSAFETLLSGAWLTRERMRLIALAVMIASLAGLGFLVATSNGLNDYKGRPLGTDFSNVYAAGTYVLEGRAAAAFDPPQQYAREQAIFGPGTQFYGWPYPPYFLFIAAALAMMPYLLALFVWQAVTFGLYLFAVRAIIFSPSAGLSPKWRSDGLWLLLAAAYPAVFVNLGHGNNGFLTAALFGFALAVLERRPVIAGISFGLIAYKPHFGIMIPLVLMASGRWRAFGAAAVTVVLLTLATLIAFGPQVWDALFASTHFTRVIVLEAGETGWHKIQSVFSWVRMWGAPIPLAYALQGGVTLAVAAALVWLWRSDAAYPLKAAALPIAAILTTPYSLDYDMMVLGIAMAFLAIDGMTRGFLPYEKTALAFLWAVPLITRSFAELTMIPLGAITMLAVFVLTLRRAAYDLSAGNRGWISAHLPTK